MSDFDKDFLDRINAYAEEVLADIDPQKTQVSVQLERLKPIMQEIAEERGISLEDVFIQYMDSASLFAAKNEQDFQLELNDDINPY